MLTEEHNPHLAVTGIQASDKTGVLLVFHGSRDGDGMGLKLEYLRRWMPQS